MGTWAVVALQSSGQSENRNSVQLLLRFVLVHPFSTPPPVFRNHATEKKQRGVESWSSLHPPERQLYQHRRQPRHRSCQQSHGPGEIIKAYETPSSHQPKPLAKRKRRKKAKSKVLTTKAAAAEAAEHEHQAFANHIIIASIRSYSWLTILCAVPLSIQSQ